MRGGLALSAVILFAACTGVTGVSPTSETEASPTTPTSASATTPGLTCWTSSPTGDDQGLTFVDVTEASALIDPLIGMHGHAAIWTDVDGDDRADLYVGTFADRPEEIYQQRGALGPSPDRLLVSEENSFAPVDIHPNRYTRTSGGVGADLDDDGDLDLVVSSNIKDEGLEQAPTQVFENQEGTLAAINATGIPSDLGGRSVAVLDFDADGLLDLFVAEDRWTGGSSVLLHNEGELRFRDFTAGAGVPADVHGLGVAVADFDGDSLSDIFVAGSNRLFLSDGPGRFAEADSTVFRWEIFGDEDDVAGASVADVNRDGLLDIAVGHHFNSTVEDGTEVSVRLYLNEGEGVFTDVTEAAGLTPLPTKAPHVELNDFDNDGWPDLLTSASAGDRPALFRHEGLDDGVPRFTAPDGLGDVQYWVGTPSADYDRDGRLDVFLVEWEPAIPSLLLRNETGGGNWLEVSVDPASGYGVGWRVEVFVGPDLIGAREITVTQGYSSGVQPIAHFGLGDSEEIEVVLTPPGADPIDLGSISANQHIRWPNGCG